MRSTNFKWIFAVVLFGLCALAGEINAQITIAKSAGFEFLIDQKLKKHGHASLKEICPIDTDATAKRIFKEYGAIFIKISSGKFPGKCIFENEAEVEDFQKKLKLKAENLGGVDIELEESAMNALLDAQKEAARMNLRITPRGGSLAARRSFQNTVNIWNSRFYPALNHWVGKRKISAAEADALKNAPLRQQIAQVLDWEETGLYFSTNLSKSILYSVAAPGTSQHIFMLALDVEEYGDNRIRIILARHGWFQTVKSDLPHFTYLGVKEMELSSLGLAPVFISGQKFWLPEM